MEKDEKRHEVIVKRINEFIWGLTILGVTMLALKCFCNPHQEGFFCEDHTIRYPYKPSTVSATVLYVICFLGPVLIMGVRRNSSDEALTNTVRLYGRNIPSWFIVLFVEVEEFFFGAACCEFFTLAGKYTVGRLRPHFIDTCVPHPDCRKLGNSFIRAADYSCRGDDKNKIYDSRTSFPSGHASLSAYTAVYMALYLQAKMNTNHSVVLKHMLQFLFITLSWVTGLSRVIDYKHHWTDVLAGFLIGVISGLVNAFYISSLFKENNTKSSDS